jgi:pyruvate/2-oxoglutarate/acetoin dehydrogenase E1 component
MLWPEQLTKAMTRIGELPDAIFIGQSVVYPGHLLFSTLEGVPADKKLELPVFEDSQMGLGIGLWLAGYSPVVSVYPRLDFLVIAANQLVNHLDKWEAMGGGNPKVIIRTMPGSITPIYSGPQHSQDHTEALRLLCPHITVIKITQPEHVYSAYQRALEEAGPFIMVEAPPKRMGYQS